MKCLAVNTATTVLSLALVEDGRTLHLFETRETRDQGNLLIKNIQDTLRANKLRFDDLGLLAVVTGPGSFTGIRIGLSAMRGLALASKKPIVGISSFDLFAVRGATSNLIAVESWREELYFRYGKILKNETPESFAERIADMPAPEVISGDAAEKIAAFLPNAKVTESIPNAVRVAEIAMNMTPGAKPVPFYMRDADVTVSGR
jgi:tRNA threonylcarbamoyladenosine biosynthesis protein TsaB